MKRAALLRLVCASALLALCGCHSPQNSSSAGPNAESSAQPAAQAPPTKEQPAPIVVPAGTTLSVTIDQSVSSKNNDSGERVAASLAEPIIIDGRGVIARGAKVTGKVTDAKSAGRFKGGAELGLTLTSIEIAGRSYPIHTSIFSQTSKGRGTRTAEGAAIGAGAGALIGVLAGGGKGAAIGAGAGGGAGVTGAALTGKRDITIPAETKLNFKLTKDLEISQ